MNISIIYLITGFFTIILLTWIFFNDTILDIQLHDTYFVISVFQLSLLIALLIWALIGALWFFLKEED